MEAEARTTIGMLYCETPFQKLMFYPQTCRRRDLSQALHQTPAVHIRGCSALFKIAAHPHIMVPIKIQWYPPSVSSAILPSIRTNFGYHFFIFIPEIEQVADDKIAASSGIPEESQRYASCTKGSMVRNKVKIRENIFFL